MSVPSNTTCGQWRMAAIPRGMAMLATPFLVLAAPFLALSAMKEVRAFPEVKAPLAYATEISVEGTRYEALLRLRHAHRFILHERLTLPDGKVEEKSRTGLWRQVHGGALLQLAGRDAVLRRLNVGGEGTLYSEVHRIGMRPVTATFRQKEDSPQPFTISGWLSWEATAAATAPLLREASTDRRLALKPDPRLEELARQGDSFHVEMLVEEDGKELKLLRMDKAVPREAGRESAGPEFFTSLVRDGMWVLSAPGLPPLPAIFTVHKPDKPVDEAENDAPGMTNRSNRYGGTLDIAGPGLSIRAAYTTEASNMTLTVEEGSLPLAVEARALADMLRAVRHWDVEGEVLVLSGGSETLCILEKTGTAPAAAARPQNAASHETAPYRHGKQGQDRPLWNWSAQ